LDEDETITTRTISYADDKFGFPLRNGLHMCQQKEPAAALISILWQKGSLWEIGIGN
jgi:hypothetical protein